MAELKHIVEGDSRLCPLPSASENGKVLKVVGGSASWSEESIGTTDYDDLSNRPRIGGVTLTGNKTLDDLGALSVSSKGMANGVAGLGANGKVPDSQLPYSGDMKHSEFSSLDPDTSSLAEVITLLKG